MDNKYILYICKFNCYNNNKVTFLKEFNACAII